MEKTKLKSDAPESRKKFMRGLLIFVLISLAIIFLLILFGPTIDDFLTPILYPNAPSS